MKINVYVSKDNIEKARKQLTEWKKTSANRLSDKGLYPEHTIIQLNRKNTKGLNRHLSKKGDTNG